MNSRDGLLIRLDVPRIELMKKTYIDIIEFELPIPTAVNASYKTGSGNFYKSAEARAWEEESLYKLMEQHVNQKPLLSGALVVNLSFHFKKDRDIDSSIKILLDLLQGRIYINDNQIQFLHVYKYKDIKDPRVEVRISTL